MFDSRRALIVVAVLLAVMFGLPGVGAVREAAAQIAVTAADPPTGEQGALNLNVLIKGRGFKNGAKAKFFKTGTTDPAGINVKATQFVSSTQLIANIDIADAAALSLFDIQVANTDGRTGKGTELFKVTTEGDIEELSAVFLDGYEDMVRSDGYGAYVSPNRQHFGGGVFFDRSFGNLLFSGWVGDYTRLVTFELGPASNVRSTVDQAGTVECRQYNGTPFPAREPAPAWLPGIADATWFLIRSEAIVTRSVVNGEDVWTSEATYSNIRDIAVGSTVVVGVNITFRTANGQQFWLYYNEEAYGGMDLPLVQGFFKVTRETADTWVLQPLGPDDPKPMGVTNQANLFMYAPEVKKVHTGGGCDFGDWIVPFKITFTAVR